MLARVPKRSSGKKPECLIRIKTKGGKVFDVEDKIACMFGRIKQTIAADDDQAVHTLSLMSLSSSDSMSSSITPTSSCLASSCSATNTTSTTSPTPSSTGERDRSNPTGLTCVKGADGEILLEKTRGGIFALMIRWATHHRRDPLIQQFHHEHAPLSEMPVYDQKFFAKLTRSQLFEMLQNSSYLQVPLLTEMLAKTIANQLKGKSIEDIRSEFGISCDYTPEEEQAIREDSERFLRRLRGDCDTDGEEEGPHAALLNKCEAEMSESERLAFAQNIIPLLNSLQSFST